MATRAGRNVYVKEALDLKTLSLPRNGVGEHREMQ
jgi:hypothetical protein